MKNIKNLMKVATIVGDDEKVLRDLYEDLGEYLGLNSSNNTVKNNPKMSVIGRKFNYSTDAKEVLRKLKYEKIDTFNFADLNNGIYVVIEYEGDKCVVRENK